MPDFLAVERPLAPPTNCIICNTHTCPEGFVDTCAEIPGLGGVHGGGRIYVCGWCVASMAKLKQYVPVEQHTQLLAHVDELEQIVDGLEHVVAAESDKKLVSISDLEQIVSGRKLARAGRS